MPRALTLHPPLVCSLLHLTFPLPSCVFWNHLPKQLPPPKSGLRDCSGTPALRLDTCRRVKSYSALAHSSLRHCPASSCGEVLSLPGSETRTRVGNLVHLGCTHARVPECAREFLRPRGVLAACLAHALAPTEQRLCFRICFYAALITVPRKWQQWAFKST